MGIFHFLKFVQMVPNRKRHHIFTRTWPVGIRATPAFSFGGLDVDRVCHPNINLYLVEVITWQRTVCRTKHCRKDEVSVKVFSSKCEQNPRELWICSHLLIKILTDKFIFCTVKPTCYYLRNALFSCLKTLSINPLTSMLPII